MFYRNKKPVIILVIAIIVLITGFLNFRLECLYQRNIIETLVRYIQISKLHQIENQMQRNYHILQSLLLTKTWEDKFAMYRDNTVSKYMGANSPNIKLLAEAQAIGKIQHIKIDSQVLLITYFYKEKNNDTVMGFLGFDCAGTRIIQ